MARGGIVPLAAGTRTALGRSVENVVPLEDNATGRRHCDVLVRPDGSIELRDLGSAGGTFVGREHITAPTILQPGAWFTIGRSTFEVVRLRFDDPAYAHCSCGRPIDLSSVCSRTLLACPGCDALLGKADGTVIASGPLRRRIVETLQRAVADGTIEDWVAVVRDDPAIPDAVIEMDDVIALLAPWTVRMKGRNVQALVDLRLDWRPDRPPRLELRPLRAGETASVLTRAGTRFTIDGEWPRCVWVRVEREVVREARAGDTVHSASCHWSDVALVDPT